MARRPLSTWEDPGFQSVLRIVRDAEVGFGNLEGNLADLPRFEGPLRGMMGSRDTARDLKAMGFDMINRANNHVFDADKEGMLSTIDMLDEAGVVHAGTVEEPRLQGPVTAQQWLFEDQTPDFLVELAH